MRKLLSVVARRDVLTTVLELLGLVSITIGAALIAPQAGWITGGVLAVGVGALLGLGGGPKGEQR